MHDVTLDPINSKSDFPRPASSDAKVS